MSIRCDYHAWDGPGICPQCRFEQLHRNNLAGKPLPNSPAGGLYPKTDYNLGEAPKLQEHRKQSACPKHHVLYDEACPLCNSGPKIRDFGTGATRDIDENKINLEGALSPLALFALARHMHNHGIMADGSQRPADNWQHGIPVKSYVESFFRHMFDAWFHYRGFKTMAREDLLTALCATMFNLQGWIHELMKEEIASKGVTK